MRPVVVMIVVVMMMIVVVMIVMMMIVLVVMMVLGHDQRLLIGGNIGRRPFILYPQSVRRIGDRVQQFRE